MEGHKVIIDIGGEKTIKVNADLFTVAGDNKFSAMLSHRWREHGSSFDCNIFVDYSPMVFMPLIEWLRLVRDSEPDMITPVRVHPAYLTSWIRMMIANAFHPQVFRKANLSAKDLCLAGCTLRTCIEAGLGPDCCFSNLAGGIGPLGSQCHFQPSDLKDTGFTATELREAGFTVNLLLQAGFDIAELEISGTPPDPGPTLREAAPGSNAMFARGKGVAGPPVGGGRCIWDLSKGVKGAPAWLFSSKGYGKGLMEPYMYAPPPIAPTSNDAPYL